MSSQYTPKASLTVTGCVGFWIFVVHCLTAERPFLDPKLLLDRNFSVGIMIAGIGAMITERRQEDVDLALKALMSGTLATGLTGAVIGVLPL